MPLLDISGDISRTRLASEKERRGNIVELRRLERWNRGKKGKVFRQSLSKVKALGKGEDENGKNVFFWHGIATGGHIISIEIKKGYRNFRLHSSMRDWLLFRWKGRYFQGVGLPFIWGRSPLWFTQVMVPFVKDLREYGYRKLAQLDEFLVAPSPYAVVADLSHDREARTRI